MGLDRKQHSRGCLGACVVRTWQRQQSPQFKKRVAQVLNSAGLGTLLIDLLTRDEDVVYEAWFNIDHLTSRLVTASKWIKEREQTAKMNIGYFGASAGAAAALKAAAMMQDTISAVIS